MNRLLQDYPRTAVYVALSLCLLVMVGAFA